MKEVTVINDRRRIRFTDPIVCGRRDVGRRAPGVACAVILALCSAGVAGAAISPAEKAAGPAAPVVQPGEMGGVPFDACRLIATAEIEKVLGEPVLETVRSARTTGGFAIAQCYYRLPTHTRSVSLEVTRAEPAFASPTAARDRWMGIFHGAAEEDEAGKPRAIAGLGEEAFWTGDAKVGALYVLDAGGIVRVSVGGGGAGHEADRIRTSRALAARAIERL